MKNANRTAQTSVQRDLYSCRFSVPHTSARRGTLVSFFEKLLRRSCGLPSLCDTFDFTILVIFIHLYSRYASAALIEFPRAAIPTRSDLYFLPVIGLPLLCTPRLASLRSPVFQCAFESAVTPEGRKRPSYINSVAKCRHDNNDLNRCQR